MTATVLIVVAGLGLLVWLGVLIGTELDTGAQRRARSRLAEERRRWADRRRAEIVVGYCDPDDLCAGCPFR